MLRTAQTLNPSLVACLIARIRLEDMTVKDRFPRPLELLVSNVPS